MTSDELKNGSGDRIEEYGKLLTGGKERVRSAQYARLTRYMRQFYQEYHHNPKLQPLVGEIGWSRNLVIMSRCMGHLEQEFYLRMTRKFGLSKNVLIHQIEIKDQLPPREKEISIYLNQNHPRNSKINPVGNYS